MKQNYGRASYKAKEKSLKYARLEKSYTNSSEQIAIAKRVIWKRITTKNQSNLGMVIINKKGDPAHSEQICQKHKYHTLIDKV